MGGCTVATSSECFDRVSELEPRAAKETPFQRKRPFRDTLTSWGRGSLLTQTQSVVEEALTQSAIDGLALGKQLERRCSHFACASRKSMAIGYMLS